MKKQIKKDKVVVTKMNVENPESGVQTSPEKSKANSNNTIIKIVGILIALLLICCVCVGIVGFVFSNFSGTQYQYEAQQMGGKAIIELTSKTSSDDYVVTLNDLSFGPMDVTEQKSGAPSDNISDFENYYYKDTSRQEYDILKNSSFQELKNAIEYKSITDYKFQSLKGGTVSEFTPTEIMTFRVYYDTASTNRAYRDIVITFTGNPYDQNVDIGYSNKSLESNSK
jgi:hypothetical protein